MTAPGTPQQNHAAEVGFATLKNRARAMAYQANLPESQRMKFMARLIKYAEQLDNLTVVEINGVVKTRYEHWGMTLPKWVNHLRRWGEACVANSRRKEEGPHVDRGAVCMFVGVSDEHAGDVYTLWDPLTDRTKCSRDVRWLNRWYYQAPLAEIAALKGDEESEQNGAKEELAKVVPPHNDEDALVDRAAGGHEDNEEAKPHDDRRTTRSGRVVKKKVKFGEELNAACTQTDEESNARSLKYEDLDGYESDDVEDDRTQMGLVGAIGKEFNRTQELHVKTYDEAMRSKDRVGWTKAVEQEYQRMVSNGVFEEVSKEKATSRPITSVWAMKRKSDGTLRARLAARGFQQIQGLHYDPRSISSPVVSKATVRMVLILALMRDWTIEIVDVRGAFLQGEFLKGEVIYMQVPKGFEKYYGKDSVLRLRKPIYGLVQASYCFWRKLVAVMEEIGFTRCKADPCLYFRWTSNGLVIWTSFIDDLMICGGGNAVKQAKHMLMAKLECEDFGVMKEYVGVKVEKSDGMAKLTQPVTVQSLDDEFDIPEDKESDAYMPATPGTVLAAPLGEPLGEADHKLYRAGCGKLQWLKRETRPDLQFSVLQLQRHLQKPGRAHLKAMFRVMRYVLATKERGLVIKPERKWDGSRDHKFKLSTTTDSSYASCPDTKRSPGGYVTYMEGAVVSTKSKVQQFVTLSPTEAELVAMTEGVKEALGNKRLLEAMGLQVELPILVRGDNKGALDLMSNWSTGGKTRHIDVRYYFLRELKEQGIVDIQWVATDVNEADLFTKNLPKGSFERHVSRFCGTDRYMSDRAI